MKPMRPSQATGGQKSKGSLKKRKNPIQNIWNGIYPPLTEEFTIKMHGVPSQLQNYPMELEISNKISILILYTNVQFSRCKATVGGILRRSNL
jgi:hypothetical protein